MFCFLVVLILCVLFNLKLVFFYKFSFYLWSFIITKPCGTCSHGSASCIHDRILHRPTGCSLNIVFSQEFSKVCHLSLASTQLLVVVQKIYQQIGVTVHSHSVESFGGLSQRCKRGSGCGELWKKPQFFLNTQYSSNMVVRKII